MEKYVLLFVVNDPRGRMDTLVVLSRPTGVAVSKQRTPLFLIQLRLARGLSSY